MKTNRYIVVLLVYSLTCRQAFSQNFTSNIDDDTAYKKLIYSERVENALVDSFIVVFNQTLVAQIQNSTLATIVGNLSTSEGAITVEKIDSLIGMVKLKVDTLDTNSASDEDAAKQERARRLLPWLKNSLVSYMEEDQIVTFATDQEFPPWGLDRIDQATLPTNNQYHFYNNGTGVTAYIVDTGISATHQDFNGRATCPISFVRNEDCTDKNGHGTHVAGTIGSTTFGVAKAVTLIGVKVLSNEGSGSNSAVLNGIEFVLQEALNDGPGKPKVCNLSLGGIPSQALNSAVAQLSEMGNVFVAVAAGNENTNACSSSPASSSATSAVVSVGATDKTDMRASFSNFGPCVTIFAPGVDIESTWFTSDSAINVISGTSMASPHVAGVAALYLEDNPDATSNDVKAQLLTNGVEGVVFDVQSSPNLLLNTEYLFESTPASPPESGAGSSMFRTLIYWTAVTTFYLIYTIS
jgi:subtilisin family serine protease